MSDSLLNLDTLNELKEIMGDEFNLLVSIFVADGKEQIEKLKLAIDSQNTEEIRQIAHTLKGSSSNLGMHQLAETCKTLESRAADTNLDNAEVLLQKIMTDYEQARSALEQIL